MEHLATQLRSQTSAPSDGSRTITLRDTQSRALDTDESSSLSRSGSVPGQSEGSDAGAVGTLRLRGVARRSTQRVAWGEDVVDNEGCGKKKSKSMSPFPSLPFFLFCVFFSAVWYGELLLTNWRPFRHPPSSTSAAMAFSDRLNSVRCAISPVHMDSMLYIPQRTAVRRVVFRV